MIFKEKHFSRYILSTDQISLSLLLEMLGNMCTVIIYFTIDDVIHFDINLGIRIKPFSYMTKKIKFLKSLHTAIV